MWISSSRRSVRPHVIVCPLECPLILTSPSSFYTGTEFWTCAGPCPSDWKNNRWQARPLTTQEPSGVHRQGTFWVVAAPAHYPPSHHLATHTGTSIHTYVYLPTQEFSPTQRQQLTQFSESVSIIRQFATLKRIFLNSWILPGYTKRLHYLVVRNLNGKLKTLHHDDGRESNVRIISDCMLKRKALQLWPTLGEGSHLAWKYSVHQFLFFPLHSLLINFLYCLKINYQLFIALV